MCCGSSISPQLLLTPGQARKASERLEGGGLETQGLGVVLDLSWPVAAAGGGPLTGPSHAQQQVGILDWNALGSVGLLRGQG